MKLHQLSYKRVLSSLASASASIPIVPAVFCRADFIESWYSNEPLSGAIKQRKSGPRSTKAVLSKLANQGKPNGQAAYMVYKDSRRLISVQDAISLAESGMQSFDLLSIHVFEPTRHHSEVTFKARRTHLEAEVEVGIFASYTGKTLKDRRLVQKIILIGKQLALTLERVTGKTVCEIIWETVIDDENRAKVQYIEAVKLSDKSQCTCKLEVKTVAAEVISEPEQFTDKRRMTKGKMTGQGNAYFLELLYKQFEGNEMRREKEHRLQAVKDKYFSPMSEPQTPALTARLQSVLTPELRSLRGSPTLTGMSNRDNAIEAVHSQLRSKPPTAMKKSRTMKVISYNKRKDGMPTKVQPSPNAILNAGATAVNKYCKERLKELDLPHYIFKHSLSPNAPSNRLVALLITEEERRLRRKGHEVGYLGTTEAVTPERYSAFGRVQYLSVRSESIESSEAQSPV
jgi:hypothetical protein